MRRSLLAVVVVGCSGGSGVEPDAGAPDGDVDAAIPDLCPNRTAPTGMPALPPASSEVFVGDITIRNALDVAALAGKKVITGNVVIEPTDLVTVALPDVEVIAGNLTIRGTGQLDVIELPALETVGGHVVEQAVIGMTTTFRMPRLETVGKNILLVGTTIDVACLRYSDGTVPSEREIVLKGHAGTNFPLDKLERGELTVGGMPNLVALSLPRFATGSLEIGQSEWQNPMLTSVSAPMFASGARLSISESPLLTSISVPSTMAVPTVVLTRLGLPSLTWLAQTTVTAINVNDLDTLTSLDGLPPSITFAAVLNNDALVDIDALATQTTFIRLAFSGCAALPEIDLPQLTTLTEELVVNQNAALTELKLPQLTTVGTTFNDQQRITANPLLPTACATAIRDQVLLTTPNADFQISGNGSGVCP